MCRLLFMKFGKFLAIIFSNMLSALFFLSISVYVYFPLCLFPIMWISAGLMASRGSEALLLVLCSGFARSFRPERWTCLQVCWLFLLPAQTCS